MEDNDDIYVMADTNTPRVSPIKPKKISLKMISLLVAVTGGILTYLVMARTSTKQQAVSNMPFTEQGTKVFNQSVLSTPNIAKSPSATNNPQSSDVLAKPFEEKLVIHFAFNNTEALPIEISKIESIWSKVKGGKGTIIIEGHADDLGSEEYNQELSMRRAEQVAGILRKLGMDNRYKVTIKGVGETRPVVNNSTEQGRSLNRRAVIFFIVEG